MANVIEATYDGKVLKPDEPLELEPNTRVRVVIEAVLPEKPEAPSFFKVARSLSVDGPPDWSENLDNYHTRKLN
jgi:predicted DNA-binding antitoxin AbrB/MazE fold protein